MGLGRPQLAQLANDPGFADPGIAGKQDDLPASSRRPAPGLQQATKLGLATDERRRSVLLWRQGGSPHEPGLRRLCFAIEDRRQFWRAAQQLSIGPSPLHDRAPLGDRDRSQPHRALAEERTGFPKIRGFRAQETIEVNHAEYGSAMFVPQLP